MEKYNFLIVDDIFTNRILLKALVKDVSDLILEAENGKEAINFLLNNDIDIILLDIEMPVMNGIETIKYIRNKMPPPKNLVPIIALTAHNPDDFFEDYKDIGFNQLITKPYSIEKIVNVIKSLCIK